MKRIYPLQSKTDSEPPNKRSKKHLTVNMSTMANIYIVPKVNTYEIRKNKDIANQDINPLINVHKIPCIRAVIESLRLYSSITKFCIGEESRNLKKIYITSQSATSGLCSTHIDKGILLNRKNYQLPALKFCLMNYKCHCFTDYDTNNGVNETFTFPQQTKSFILNSNFPATIISIEINNEIIGYFFIKSAAPSNLKRMAQPATFKQFRMSVSQSIKLKSNKYRNLEILIDSITKNKEYGIGIGYYFNGRCNNILDVVCCITNINDTQFTICTDANTAINIQSIRFKMRREQSMHDITIFEKQFINNQFVNNQNTQNIQNMQNNIFASTNTNNCIINYNSGNNSIINYIPIQCVPINQQTANTQILYISKPQNIQLIGTNVIYTPLSFVNNSNSSQVVYRMG